MLFPSLSTLHHIWRSKGPYLELKISSMAAIVCGSEALHQEEGVNNVTSTFVHEILKHNEGHEHVGDTTRLHSFCLVG